MKRGARKLRRISRREKFNVRKTLPFKILIACVIALLILLFVWVGFKIGERERGKELEGELGELGTLCIFCSENPVVLDVLNYTIYNNNQTINVTIKWSEGDINPNDFDSILVEFSKIEEDCNATILDSLTFGENKSYTLVYDTDTTCLYDFTNLTSIDSIKAYAEVNIHLTQKGLIPNITFYKDSSRQNLINLDQYFSSLVNVNYSLVESPDNGNISVSVDNTTKNISISVLDSTWFGAQKFDLTATETDGGLEVLNTGNSGENMSFYIIVVDANLPISNQAPDFISGNCSNFIIDLKTTSNLIINMEDCFKDDDGPSALSFRFDNSSMKNISISRRENNLTFSPRTGFIGKEYLTLYANDSIDEEDGRVYVNVTNSSFVNTTVPVTNDPKILSSSPSNAEVYMFPGNKSFSITAGNYASIKWYLNGGIITDAEGRLSYDFSNLKEGDIVKVEVINGTRIDSKTWTIKIEKDEEGEEPVFDVGNVIFYSIIAVIGVIILLVVWLFIIEKNKGGTAGVGFGVSGSGSNVKIRGGRGSSLDYFNIPG